MAERVGRLFDDHDVLLTPVMSAARGAAGLMEGRGATVTYLWETGWVPFNVLWNSTGSPPRRCPPASPTRACRSPCSSSGAPTPRRRCCRSPRSSRPPGPGRTAARRVLISTQSRSDYLGRGEEKTCACAPPPCRPRSSPRCCSPPLRAHGQALAPCSGLPEELGASCGSLEVPLDRANPRSARRGSPSRCWRGATPRGRRSAPSSARAGAAVPVIDLAPRLAEIFGSALTGASSCSSTPAASAAPSRSPAAPWATSPCGSRRRNG